MTHSLTRRHFLGTAAAAGVALGTSSLRAARVGDKLIVGVMGTGGRGTSLATSFQKQENVEVAYTCDVDEDRAGAARDAVIKAGGKDVQAVTDYRKILDDPKVDILVVATCNHWHAPAAILGMKAGKHVYVEKPCSHNPREGELLVEAARRYDKRVQMGNQRRSWPMVIEAINRVREGVIGRAYFAQSWYLNNRPTIGVGQEVDPPKGLNYALWEGPAPHKPFRSNYLHYNWHWFWHWGNGELGNNGVHTIDLCRWGLGVDYPIKVESSGGRFHFKDDQETPDTNVVTYTFPGDKAATWEGLSCTRLPSEMGAIAVFVGEKGSLKLNDNGYTIYDPRGKELEKVPVKSGDDFHISNFLEAVRGGAKLNSEIEEGHKSTLLCHLGNIAYRVGRSLKCDPSNGRIINDKDAMALWTREYAKGYEPTV